MNWKRSVLAGAGLLVAVTVAGVSYGITSGGADDGEGIATLDPSDWPMRVAVFSPYPRPEAISEDQWALVNDGWVSDDDMRAAVEATVACAAEDGVSLAVQGGGENGVARTLGFVSPSGQPSAAVAACIREHVSAVSYLYERQRDTRTFVGEQDYYETMGSCLRGAGIEPTASQTDEEFVTASAGVDHRDAWQKCQRLDIAPLVADAGHREQFSLLAACLTGHGYAIPSRDAEAMPFWTPARLNAIQSDPELLAAFRVCEVANAMTAQRRAPSSATKFP